MPPQQKLLRVFQLIRLLSRSPYPTVAQLSSWLHISPRTVYRYIGLLEEIGYVIDKTPEERYFIHEPDVYSSSFTPEETRLLKELMAAAATHPLRKSILEKLYLHSEILPLAETVLNIHAAQLVEQLATAIRDQRQIRLKDYHSANQGTISDRLVEPLAFTENYRLLAAFEPASGQIKTFHVERIQAVEKLPCPITYTRPVREPDLFGMMGENPIAVCLCLNDRAYRLLVEEVPKASRYIHHKNGTYYFEGNVQDLRGVGRFVLGLLGEVEVIHPPELQEYICQRIQKFQAAARL